MLKNKGKFIFILIFAILFGILFWEVLNFLLFRGEVLISTNKSEYKKGENIIVKIENKTNKKICFSSCYPYYLERKNGEWKSYLYDNCPELDLTTTCIKPNKEKFFQIDDFSYAKEGSHRLLVPVCVGCDLAENFKEDKKFYSNEFLIK